MRLKKPTTRRVPHSCASFAHEWGTNCPRITMDPCRVPGLDSETWESRNPTPACACRTDKLHGSSEVRGTAFGRRATITSMSSRVEGLWRSCATSTAIPSPGDWSPSSKIGRGRVSGTGLPARLGRSRSNPTGPGTTANIHNPHSSRYRRDEWGTQLL